MSSTHWGKSGVDCSERLCMCVGGWVERVLEYSYNCLGVRAIATFKDQLIFKNESERLSRHFALQRDSNFIKRNC